MNIEKRLERIEAILDARGLDWDHPGVEEDHFADANKMVVEGPSTEAVRSDSLGDGYRIPSEGDIGKVVEVRHAMGESWVQRKLVKVLSDSVPGCAALRHCQFLCSLDQSQTMATCWRWARIKIDEPAKEQAEEQPKKWRILGVGEEVQEGDRVKAKASPPSDPPNGLGWCRADPSVGTSVFEDDPCVFARPVAEEPAKEPEHRAGPMPDPGEGYRLLSKDPPEELNPNAEWWDGNEDRWCGIFPTNTTAQHPRVWYRLKTEPAEPEYREPVLPADAGKECEFSDDSISWEEGVLIGWSANLNTFNWESARNSYPYARIKKDA